MAEQGHVEDRLNYSNAAVVLNEAKLANGIHEKLTWGYVVPVISTRGGAQLAELSVEFVKVALAGQELLSVE